MKNWLISLRFFLIIRYYQISLLIGLETFFLVLQGLSLGKNLTIYSGFEIRTPKNIFIGDNTIIGHNVVLDGRNSLEIGNNVNISGQVIIWTMQHDYNSSNFDKIGGKVVVKDYCWISAWAIILPDILIEEGTVVAANAIITKNTQKYKVFGEVPAKIIGERNKNLTYKLTKKNRIHFV